MGKIRCRVVGCRRWVSDDGLCMTHLERREYILSLIRVAPKADDLSGVLNWFGESDGSSQDGETKLDPLALEAR